MITIDSLNSRGITPRLLAEAAFTSLSAAESLFARKGRTVCVLSIAPSSAVATCLLAA